MSEQTVPTGDDIGIHLRVAQQQIQALKSQPGTNVDLTGVEQSINAALDLHTRSLPTGGEADYSAFTDRPTGDDLAARGIDQPATPAELPADAVPTQPDPTNPNPPQTTDEAAQQAPDTADQTAPVENPPTA